ncbi:TAXI family TRAP transporter solute-binding subunit [Garicola koreensis]
MNIRRTSASVAALAALTALAACGNGNGDDGGTDSGTDADSEVQTGSEGDFVTDLEFVTGGTAGTYYPLGGELSDIFSSNTDASVNYVESGGSADNLGRIYQEQSQLGLTQNDTAANAYNGDLQDLEGQEIDNFGWISNLYPEAMHIVVREDSGIESVEDLDGTTIAVGDVGSGTRAISDAIIDYYGIEYTAEETDFGSSTEMLADGQIDATMFVVGVPVAGLTEVSATTDVELLSLDDSDVEEMVSDEFYESYSISADAYDFLDEDVTTISVFAALVASTTQVSEDLAYDLTAALFDNAGDITLDVGENISTEEALLGIGDIPLHPGAERYFDEQGIDLP